MDYARFLDGEPVELRQMLDARERRAQIQRSIQGESPLPLISFSLNIAGPIKVFPLAVRTYEEGLAQIRCQCKVWSLPIRSVREVREATGYEAFFSVDAPAKRIKEALIYLEQSSSLGRLFDMDVLDADGKKLSRAELGAEERTCILCGEPAFVCGSIRAHPLDKLQSRTCEIMWDYFAERYADRLASTASRALLCEVLATPKPGLVDKAGSGAHRDMDIVTFETSALALIPWFRAFAAYGIEHCSREPERFLEDLRPMGLQAEFDMRRATGGVNTHKGVIFSLGLMLTALGVFYGEQRVPDRRELRELCRQIAAPLAGELSAPAAGTDTHGGRLYAEHGVRGARGEAVDGFPTLFDIALPALDGYLADGNSLNDAGAAALLPIIAAAEDTNLIARSSYRRAAEIQEEIRGILERGLPVPGLLAEAERLDRVFTAENISPGGSADLLALAYFVKFLEGDGLTK